MAAEKCRPLSLPTVADELSGSVAILARVGVDREELNH
jgi:hypothetical protein